MSSAASKISVIVDASDSELLAAVKRSADALKGLGDTIARQSTVAQTEGKKMVTANQAIADSYDKMAVSARGSVLEVVKSVQTQVAEQQRAADGAVRAAELSAEANGRVADSAKVAATETSLAADKQMESYAKTADAARVSSDAQIQSAAKTRDASVKAYGAGGSALVEWGKKAVLAATGIAAASVYMSSKFESSTLRLHTQAGATVKEMERMREGILKMAPSLGQTPEHLTEGLYHIVSSMDKVIPAGNRVNDMLHIMKIAAEGAAVGNTSMEETSYALASAMNALHEHAGAAYKTMGDLNAIVGSGDMTMSDLLAALKSGLIPTAQQFGISLQSLGAALAVMGDMGMRGAMAGTRLRMSIALLGAPSAAAAKMLTAIGMSGGEVTARTTAMTEALQKAKLSTTTLSKDLKQPNGLEAALSDLKHHLIEGGLSAEESAALMVRAFGGGRMSATIDLLSQNTGRLGIKYRQISQESMHFGGDWAKVQETLKFQLDQTVASVESLGIKIGTALTPYVEDLLKGLKETAEWFGHNKTAADDLAVVVGGALSVAVGAFVANRIAKLVSGLKEVGQAGAFMREGFRTPGTAARSTGAAGVAGASGLGAAGISGARGLEAPGSIANPIVVTVEAGQYAGLGGQAAANSAVAGSEGDVKAAASEGGTVAGGAANSSSIIGSVRSGLGTIMDRTMKGGMLALMGTFASELAGQIVGGHAGKTVSSIGKDTALGAAIGTVIEPGIGTAIGGGLGAIAASLKHLSGGTQAEHVQNSLENKGVSGTAAGTLAKAIEKANKTSEQEFYKVAHEQQGVSSEIAHFLHEHTFGIVANPPGNTPNPAVHREIEEKKQAELYGAGKTFGSTFAGEIHSKTTGFSGAAQVTALITQTTRAFKELPVSARQGALTSITEMVKTYEDKKELPAHAVQEVVGAIEAKFPELVKGFSDVGTHSVSALNNALKGQQTLGGLEQLVNNWREIFPELPHIVGLNMKNAETEFGKVNAQLVKMANTGPESMRRAYSEILGKMKEEEIKYFSEMRKGIEQETSALQKRMKTEAPDVVSPLEEAFNRMVKLIHQEMNAGVKDTTTGTKEINKILQDELKTLGINNNSATQKKAGAFGPGPGSGGTGLQPTGVGGSQGFQGNEFNAKGTGGMVGSQGERGHDNVPIVVGRGEAILNHQQQAMVNGLLAQHGTSLGGVYAATAGSKHYMSGGGFAGGGFSPGSAYAGLTRGRIDQGVDFGGSGPVGAVGSGRVMSVGLWPGWPGTGGVVYSTPRGIVYVMEDFAPSVRAGQQLTAGQIIGNATGGQFGIETGWANSSGTAPIVQYGGLPDGTPMPGGKGFSSFLGGGGGSGVGGIAAALQKILAPKVGGTSIFALIAQAALNKIAGAANQGLGSSSASFSSVSGTGGSNTANEALGKAMMLAAGWSGSEWPDLQKLWMKESGWSSTAVNPSSGAAGIAQSLGHGSVRLGDARGQIEWGLNYIRERYGSPAAAWAHEMANNWYAEGGLVGFASGGKTGKGVTIRAPSSKYKPKGGMPKASKGKHGAAKTKVPQFHSLLSKLREIPLMGGFIEQIEARAESAKQMAAEESMLAGFENQAAFILPADMKYLESTLQPGQNIHPGMTVPQAERERQRWLDSNEGNPETDLQGELLSWISGLDNHKLLTAGDVGILKQFPGGVPFAPGYPMFAGQKILLEEQMKLEELVAKMASGGMTLDESLIDDRESREKTIERKERALERVQEKDVKRLKHLQADERGLTSTSLKAKEQAARSSYAHQVRVADANEQKQAIKEAIQAHKESIASEREAESKLSKKSVGTGKGKHQENEGAIKQHKENIASDTAEQTRLQGELLRIHVPPLLTGKNAVNQAHIAVLKNEIKDEEVGLEETLQRIGGSRTTVGKTGERGPMHKEVTVLTKQLNALRSTDEALGPKLSEAKGALPTLEATLMGIAEAAQNQEESLAPVLARSTQTENTMLTAALQAQNKVLGETVAIQGAQLSTLKNFTANVPHFERGGPVVDDGLAYLHKGEHVVPTGGTLAVNSTAPNVTTEVNVHGDIGPLIGLIDSRITHPRNVNAISREQMRRTQMIRGGAFSQVGG